jgi:hypothetical protein
MYLQKVISKKILKSVPVPKCHGSTTLQNILKIIMTMCLFHVGVPVAENEKKEKTGQLTSEVTVAEVKNIDNTIIERKLRCTDED